MKKAGLRPAFLLMSQDKIANSNKRDISLSRFPFLLYSFFTTLPFPFFPYYLALPTFPALTSLLFLLFPALTSFPLSPFSSLFSLLFPIFPYQKSIAYYALQPSFHTSSSQTPVSTFLRPFRES